MAKGDKPIIITDTREPKFGEPGYYDFSRFDVVSVWADLNVGDFTLGGCDLDGVPYSRLVMIERKTISDLIGSFTAGRKRFEKMWLRCPAGQYRFLLIEGNELELMRGIYRSRMHPNSVLATIASWSMKYQFNVFFTGGPETGACWVYWILREFQRLHTGG